MARKYHHEKFRLEDGFIGYIITLFHNKRMLSGILTACVVLIGVLFAVRIQREAMPNIQSDNYLVTVSYPGASPVQVEQDAIIPIEDVVKEISGVLDYSSTSSQDSGTVRITVDEDVPDPDVVGDEIYRKMSLGNISGIAAEVESLKVERFGTTDIAVYMLALRRNSKEEVDDLLFNQAADSLASQIKTLSGVSKVNTTGYREQQVEINVNPRALARNYVDINSVVNAVKGRNVRSTSGTLEDPNNYKVIVTISEYEDLGQLSNTVIRAGFDGNRVLLRDVADVNLVFPQKTSYTRVDLEEAILLEVYKTSSADIVKTSSKVKVFLEEKGDTLLPEGMRWTEINDEGHSVDEVSRILIGNGVIGFILILLVLFLFLDFTTAFWTACGLPVTMVLTLGYMGATGLSVNYLTLTAMITMIGMLVDHGIVISETIFARRIKGFPPLRAAIEGLKSVFWPVVVTVSTTVMAFLPLLIVGGTMGKFTRFFPIMVTVMLTFSFLEACFLLVSHLLHVRSNAESPGLLRREAKNIAAGRMAQDTWFSPLVRGYQVALRGLIRFRWPSLILFLALLVVGVLFSMPAIKNFTLFDDTDVPVVQISYRPEVGVTLEKAQEDAKQLEQRILDITPESQIKYVWNNVSSGRRGDVTGTIVIYLVDKKDRTMVLAEYNQLLSANLLLYGKRSREVLLRGKGGDAPEGDAAPKGDRSRSSGGKATDTGDTEVNPYLLSPEEMEQIPVPFENVRIGFAGGAGGPGGRAISIRLYSNDAKELREAGEASVELLESMRGTQDIENSDESEVEQIRVTINYREMARYGIRLSDVNSTLRTAFQGTTATKSRSGAKATDYVVRLQEPYRKSLRTILSLEVKAGTGQFIPLSRFAKLTTELSSPGIRHYNGYRTLRLTGDVDTEIEGVTSLTVSQEFTDRFAQIRSEYPSVTLDLSGGEAERTRRFLADLIPAFVVAIILILLILILLFDSFLQPLIVMGSIPFGLVGGLVALQLHGLPAGFMAMLGFMGLMGVVVNDSVVMVEFINNIVHRYPHAKSRLLEPLVLKGAGRRFRAVVLTTLTTVLGLFPTIYGLSGDPGFVRPVVLVLGYGLLAATLITLFFIPAVYMIQLDLTYLVGRWKDRLFSGKGRNGRKNELGPGLVAIDKQRLAGLEELEEQELPPDPWV
ncbi:efflux RND transporter permease subunit [Candidatus Haliotispira prima]|uniref:Efflux RND transporter permease subunit n=1 Tax=Candidatus Haliotispira prima TaxID=3034016 RepID=A0ABY8MIQ4_9SPIO|nr:efflux RND transporter permease subunit [Candidatus Haliotispira prima]